MSPDDDRLRTFLSRFSLSDEAAEALSLLLSGESSSALDGGGAVDVPAPSGLVVGEALGRGGMGEVVVAHDPELGRDLALKTLRPDLAHSDSARARFLEEAQATAQLQHPGVIPVHGYGTLPDGRPYFTMPQVRGRSLEALIDAGEVPLRRRVEVLRRVCEAVGYAHERGVVHRDLKPDNVMVGAHGEVLVLDWGLARVAGEADAPASAGQATTTRSLQQAGRGDEVPLRSPREWHGLDAGGAAFWGVGDDGHVHIGPDTDGDLWAPDWPVMMIDYRSVVAYLAWRSERDGLPWRLPSEFEWEKAARGVDGRAYPWGDHHEPTWCAMRSSPSLGPGGRDDYPVDTSPYGARHMAGSCTEWCLESYEHPLDDDGERVVVPPLRADDARHVSRGGSWSTSAYHCRIASRGHGSSHRGMYSKTARMVRPWPPQPSSETSASST